MVERHFDLAPLTGGTLEGFGALERAHLLAFGLEDVARDDPFFSFGAARLQGAGAAILGARKIRYGTVLVHQPGAFELLADGTNKAVGLRLESERGTGEETIGPVLAVEQWNMGLDPTPHQPADHQPRSVGGIGGQPLRVET